MDEELRALERRWLSSGAEEDQHRWLCHRLRLGWADELQGAIARLEEVVAETFADDPDVVVECRVGFEACGDPAARLSAFSGLSWRPAPAPDFVRLLDPRQLAGLYPHRAYDVGPIGGRFSALFAEGALFTSQWAYGGGGAGWEMAHGSAVGGALGPLVGYVSIEARDSL